MGQTLSALTQLEGIKQVKTVAMKRTCTCALHSRVTTDLGSTKRLAARPFVGSLSTLRHRQLPPEVPPRFRNEARDA